LNPKKETRKQEGGETFQKDAQYPIRRTIDEGMSNPRNEREKIREKKRKQGFPLPWRQKVKKKEPLSCTEHAGNSIARKR